MTENKWKQKRRLLCIVLGGVLAVAVLCYILLEMRAEKIFTGAGCSISLDSGFYTDNRKLTISVSPGTVVYYTDNCEVPDKEHGIQYTAPISIAASKEEQVYVFRFRAYYEDGKESEIFNRVYFTGENIDQRYTTNVLHITGDPEELFGYEEGILASGRIFDEFMEKNSNIHYGGGVDANYMQRGREWEREVFIQYFDTDGKELLAQNGGMRVHGGASRMKNQKSFQLYARKEYDEQNVFDYIFLKDLVSEKDGSLAKKHKRVIIRSGGTDNGFAYLRSELASTLAGDAGFPDVMRADPVTVYINGDYRGVYWLENTYDAQYFENRYGEYDGEFVVLEGSDVQKKDSDEDNVQEFVNEFNEKYHSFSTMDLTVDENYQELQKFIDVENYLKYIAIENYVGNYDWPGGNLKVYRFVSPEDNYIEDTVFDGKYRYLLYDLDYAFGLLTINDTVGFLAETLTLEKVLGGDTPLFAALMEREDCRQYFINYSCDLMNDAMSAKNVSETLMRMHSSRQEELRYMLEETSLAKEEIWDWESSIGSYSNVEMNFDRIVNFATDRPRYVLWDMVNHLHVDVMDIYTLELHHSGDFSTVQINSIRMEGEEFSGVYFASVPVTIKPCVARNEKFAYWIVNGEVREEEELRLSAGDVKEQAVHVEMVVEEAEEPFLQINAVKAKGTSDFIELVNYSYQPINTLGYFLSDNEDSYKYAIPTMTLQPGESRRFYGKNCMGIEGLGEIGLNFNVKEGETITLTYGRQTVETLCIPDLSEEGIYRRDVRIGRFVERYADSG